MNVSASSNALIYGGNEFSFNKNGVTVYHNSSVPINGNNQFSNNTDSGVSLSRSSSFENWSGVQTFENNSNRAIGIYGSSAVRIENPNIVNSTKGISLGSSSSIELVGGSI